MEQIEYKYGSIIIKAEIQYSNRKTLDLRVFPEGNVIVTAPLNTVDYKILEKVKLKSKWILQQQRTFSCTNHLQQKNFIFQEKHIGI